MKANVLHIKFNDKTQAFRPFETEKDKRRLIFEYKNRENIFTIDLCSRQGTFFKKIKTIFKKV